MEKIIIKNFAGIEELEIELNRINVFVGQQASGKSVTAKLIYYFKGITRDLFESALLEKTKTQAFNRLLSKFDEYFPSDTWPSRNFEITYLINSEHIKVKKEKSKLKFEVTEKIDKLYNISKRIIRADRNKFKPEDQFEIYSPSYSLRDKYMLIIQKELGESASSSPLFIPAGRSFFANLQSSIFSFLSNNKAIDPLLVEFGSFYENVKSTISRPAANKDLKNLYSIADKLILDIIGSKYQREKNKDYLIHIDKRKINVSFSSSGQQETLPLILILKALLRISFAGNYTTIFIEEPEAHLFPAAQKKIVELMALAFNKSRSPIQIIITTHSPYVLTSINNLMQANMAMNSLPDERKSKIFEFVTKETIIDEKLLNAYFFKNNTAKNIMDTDTNLIHSKYLDEVSEIISTEFDNILNMG